MRRTRPHCATKQKAAQRAGLLAVLLGACGPCGVLTAIPAASKIGQSFHIKDTKITKSINRMPVAILTISQSEASQIVAAIILKAADDGGSPVAVAVVDYAGRLVAFAAMDGVMPASIKLSQSKAYSAVLGQRDTLQWASTKKHPELIDFDMRNWTDDNFTCFTGGVIISLNGQVIGGIGVSGRKGKQDASDTLMQDNELATFGKTVLNINSST